VNGGSRSSWPTMRLIFLNGLAAGALAVALFAGCKTGDKPKATASKPTLPWRESFDIATEAYIFGYPLITMDMTRRVMTNVRYPDGMHAPMGQFAQRYIRIGAAVVLIGDFDIANFIDALAVFGRITDDQ